TYNSSASVSIWTDYGDWYNISNATAAKQVRNLHLTDVQAEENMEITSELTFNAISNYNFAGIVFYLENGNMVTVERRFHSGQGSSIFALVGNTSTIGSGAAASTTEGSPTNGWAAVDTRPDDKAELRLVKNGDVYSAYFRYFGDTEWTKIANDYTNANIGSTGVIKVGLAASFGSGNLTSRLATFENFKLDGTVLPFTDYKVSFESNGGSAIGYMIADIDGTEKLEEPTPVKEGFEFAGWFTDAELTEAFDFDTAITSDLTLYAKFVELPEGLILSSEFIDGGKVSAVLQNYTQEDVSGWLIIALYDTNGKMTSVTTEAVDLAYGESVDLEALVGAADDNYQVFVWDASFAPLLPAESGTIVQE
ncbi:MAG: InlB B-repeat-containing protein, partial [Clostridiales bacterium]|nr:InlB B-repeat-containing protein [Clostridiales bacterium]